LTVLLVIVLGCIASEKPARTLARIETPVALEAGLTLVTVGLVVSAGLARTTALGDQLPASSRA
jgi:hypothetical protein